MNVPTPSYVDLREVLARHLADEYYADEDWPKLPERKREYYRAKADEILAVIGQAVRPA